MVLIRQFRNQNRIFWRTPVAAFFTLVLPLIMLVLLVAVFGNDELDGFGGEAIYPTVSVSELGHLRVRMERLTTAPAMIAPVDVPPIRSK